jgi:hypothetical protein
MLQAEEEARVGSIRVAGFSVSLDGFGAGPEQSLQDPLGKRGTELHSWFFGTKTFKAMFGEGGGADEPDSCQAPNHPERLLGILMYMSGFEN